MSLGAASDTAGPPGDTAAPGPSAGPAHDAAGASGPPAPAERGPAWGPLLDFEQALAPLLQALPHLGAQASPRLARAWAEAIAQAWRCWADQRLLDPGQPLCLLDLTPGPGRLALELTRALSARSDTAGLRWCYVALAEGAEASALWRHPELEARMRSGQFDTASWAGLRSGRLRLPGAGLCLQGARNPVMALAMGGWSGLAPSLWCAHHGTLFRGRCRLALDADSALLSECDWVAANAAACPQAQRLLAQYLRQVASAAVTLPLAALRALQALQGFSASRYALLLADQGCTSLLQLRLGAAWPPARWQRGHTRLPLNLHALRWQQEAQGAQVWERQLADAGWAVQLALSGVPHQPLLAQMAEAMEHGHPHDEAGWRAQMPLAQTPQSALRLLRALAHDPQALAPLCERLVPQMDALDTAQREAWCQALTRTHEVWRRDGAEAALAVPLARLAGALRLWGLARSILQTKAPQGGHERGLCLAQIEAQTGQVAQALARLNQPMWRHDGPAQALRRSLRERMQQWAALDWYGGRRLCHAELSLEPVGPEHQQALLARYRDAQIALLTGLPRLDTAEQALQWLRSLRATPGSMDFAIMHRDHGFAGMVGSRRIGSTASFYFWLGAELQGERIGPRAARLLFAHLRALGVGEVVTSVLQQNLRSLACMRRLGFHELPLKAQPPADVYKHFGLALHGQAVDTAQLGQALCRLYQALGGSLLFETPAFETPDPPAP